MNLQTLIDAYRASYQGRHPSLRARLDFWRKHLGHVELQAIDADVVDDAMAALASRGALKFIRGQGIISANRPFTPATLNRHLVALGTTPTVAWRVQALQARNAGPTDRCSAALGS